MRKKCIGICICLSLFMMISSGCVGLRRDKDNFLLKTEQQSSTVEHETDEEIKDSPKNDELKNNPLDKEETEPTAEKNDYEFKQKLDDIMSSAKYGTVLNLEFKDGETNISDIEDKWGKADTTDYVEGAKGYYSTYSDHNMVFGWNKGGQIFEIRYMGDPETKVPCNVVKEIYGEPDYVSSYDECAILGYKVNEKFKLLMVFDGMSEDAKLDHYSVLYPEITANSMKADPGRDW